MPPSCLYYSSFLSSYFLQILFSFLHLKRLLAILINSQTVRITILITLSYFISSSLDPILSPSNPIWVKHCLPMKHLNKQCFSAKNVGLSKPAPNSNQQKIYILPTIITSCGDVWSIWKFLVHYFCSFSIACQWCHIRSMKFLLNLMWVLFIQFPSPLSSCDKSEWLVNFV